MTQTNGNQQNSEPTNRLTDQANSKRNSLTTSKQGRQHWTKNNKQWTGHFLTGGMERGGCDICVARACADARHTNNTRAFPQTTFLLCQNQGSLRHWRVICLSQMNDERWTAYDVWRATYGIRRMTDNEEWTTKDYMRVPLVDSWWQLPCATKNPVPSKSLQSRKLNRTPLPKTSGTAGAQERWALNNDDHQTAAAETTKRTSANYYISKVLSVFWFRVLILPSNLVCNLCFILILSCVLLQHQSFILKETS